MPTYLYTHLRFAQTDIEPEEPTRIKAGMCLVPLPTTSLSSAFELLAFPLLLDF